MLHKVKRLTLPERLEYVGPSGSMVVDTTLNNVFIQDGAKPGGYAVHEPVSLDGPSKLIPGIPNEFTIVDFDDFSQYEASVEHGSVSREGPTLIVEPSEGSSGIVTLIVKRDGIGSDFQLQIGRPFGPGPQALIAGDMSAGFFGEVSPTTLIKYSALTSLVGISGNTSYRDDESVWLKFALDGAILYVAKKPAAIQVSWDQINARNAVYGGLILNIKDHRFKCRLLRGTTEEPFTAESIGYNPPLTEGSEWNRLMYPIHSGVHTDPNIPVLPEMGTWARYSDVDLITYNIDGGIGQNSWTQNMNKRDDGTRSALERGGLGITHSANTSTDFRNLSRGWRPVLELVP